MSQFYGTLIGSAKNPATARGHKNTGLDGHIRGEKVGAKISMYRNGKDDADIMGFSVTNGSYGGKNAPDCTLEVTCFDDERPTIITGIHVEGALVIKGNFTEDQVKAIHAVAALVRVPA